MMASGVIPGNRNADNIDEKLAASEFLVFPNKSIETPEIKAFSVTSFGFGQKGAQVIGVHPKYLFATLSKEEYDIYCTKVGTRRQKAYRYFQDGFYGNNLVVVKEKSPYEDGQMETYLINPESRLK
jgi:fatty acid synthase subunit alpha, fungi type